MTGDLISREALTDRSEVLYQHTDSGKIIPWSAVRVCVINNAPATDAVPVAHGRWYQCKLNVPKGKGQTYLVWKCSNCHKHERKRSDYCPNCGARMDGEVNSDRGEKSCIVDGTNVRITNEPFVIEGGFVVDVGKKAD